MNTGRAVTTLLAGIICINSGYSTPKGPIDMQTGQHAKTFEAEIRLEIKRDYLLYLPEDYGNTEEKWPLVLFLHGAGERGDDLDRVAVHGPPKLVSNGKKEFPFILVSPQCPKDDWWTSNLQITGLDALITDIVSRYNVDEDRIYVTGLSMGGFGTWTLAATTPNRFAAIAPICGGGEPETAPLISHLPIWVFHGAKDTVVPLKRSQEMVDALKRTGADVDFTVYPEAGHDSWTETYNNPAFYEWLLTQTRKDP